MKLFLTGFMGSGKTYTAKALAERLHLPCFDLDKLIEEQQQRSIEQLFSEVGETEFRKIEHQILHDFIERSPDHFVMATGGGAPCFFNNSSSMKAAGIVLFLDVSPDVLTARLFSEMEKRPLLRPLSKQDLLSFIEEKLSVRRPYYEQCHVIYEVTHLQQNVVADLTEILLRF